MFNSLKIYLSLFYTLSIYIYVYIKKNYKINLIKTKYTKRKKQLNYEIKFNKRFLIPDNLTGSPLGTLWLITLKRKTALFESFFIEKNTV